MNIGIATNAATRGQPTLASAPVPVTKASSFNPPVLPTVQSISIPSTSSTPLMSTLDNLESGKGSSSHATNLVKPSYFSPPAALLMPLVPSSVPAAAPPLHPPVTMQQPYGTPLLQPFPPPSPSASLAPTQNFGPVITRDKVRDALLRIVQVNFVPLYLSLFTCILFFGPSCLRKCFSLLDSKFSLFKLYLFVDQNPCNLPNIWKCRD